MARFTRHAIDIVNTQRVTGWCYSRMIKKRPVVLQFFVDGVLIGEASADEYRQDLYDLAVHPTGKCGFTYLFSDDLNLHEGSLLDIRLKGRMKSLVQYKTTEIPKVIVSDLPSIVFMHIPKTAGTSFNTYARLFFPDKLSIIHIEKQGWEKHPEFCQPFSYIAGHLTLEKMEQLFSVDRYDYYTIIREPYSHLHSHLNWLRGIGKKENRGFFSKHPKVIQDLAVKLNNNGNDITSFLKDMVGNLDGFQIDFFDNLQTRYFLNYRPDRVGMKDLETAQQNCTIFREIGLTESYEEFTSAFCKNHGLQHIKQPEALNRSRYQPLYEFSSSSFQDIVYPLVKADLELYEYVKSKGQVQG